MKMVSEYDKKYSVSLSKECYLLYIPDSTKVTLKKR